MSALHAIVPLLLLAATAAQTTFPVGQRDVAWPNTSGQGSATLGSRVLYPAAIAGVNAPVLPRPGGWPAIVFLHGFATSGSTYAALGDEWASRGFVVVLSNTSTFGNLGQELDGRALFGAIGVANQSGPFQGSFDPQRIGLAGHSMGGGNVGNVLADNPGYRCGFAIAPVTPRGNNATLVLEPIAIVAGQGDVITPWQIFAQPFYQGLTAWSGIKQLYLLDGSAGHSNLAGLFGSGSANAAVFDRVVRISAGFFRRWLEESPLGLEDAIGPAALAEPRLVSSTLEVADPQVWLATPLQLATTIRVSVASEPGLAGAFAAFALAPPTPTAIGPLRLDPAVAFVAVIGVADVGRRVDGSITVPNDPQFVGLTIALQAAGQTAAGGLRLGNAFVSAVAP